MNSLPAPHLSSDSGVGNLPTSQMSYCSFLLYPIFHVPNYPQVTSTLTEARSLPLTPIGDLLSLNWFPERLSPERLITTSIKEPLRALLLCRRLAGRNVAETCLILKWEWSMSPSRCRFPIQGVERSLPLSLVKGNGINTGSWAGRESFICSTCFYSI